MPRFGSEEDQLLQITIEKWKLSATEGFYAIEAAHQYGYGYSGQGGNPTRDWERDRYRFWNHTASLVEALAHDYPTIDPRPIQAIYSAIAAWHAERGDENLPDQSMLENLLDQALIACNVLEAGIRRRRMVREEPGGTKAPPEATDTDDPGPAAIVSPDEERNAYIYTQMTRNVALAEIRGEVNRRQRWEPLNSVQGVSQAARRHAEKHKLPWPIERPR